MPFAEYETKPAFVVEVNGKRTYFQEIEPARAAATLALGAAAPDPDDFGGGVSWYVETVPATPLDELLVTYGELHDEFSADGVDRESPLLMVESGRYGHYLTSGLTAEELVRQHDPDDWELIGIFDARTGEQVHGEITQTVSY